MSQPKFSPGPWLRDTDGTLPIRIYVEDGRWKDSVKTVLAEVGCDIVRGTGEYQEDHANASLIAAAPDLYAALESVQESLDLLFSKETLPRGEPLLPEGSVVRGITEGAFFGVREQIAAALAKARGEEVKH